MKEPYRLEVIWEGAIDLSENFDEDSIWDEWNTQLEDLEENCANEDWVLTIYDERTEPPELVKEHRNGDYED